MYENFLRNSNTPLYLQLCNFLKKEILEGNINSGAKLPSIRILANKLNVSRNTVEIAYQQLIAEGFAISRPRSGIYANYHNSSWTNTLNRKQFCKEKIRSKNKELYDFSYGRLKLCDFPASYLKKFTCINFQEDDDFPLRRDPQGEYGLRIEVAKYLHYSRGVKCLPEQIVIGAGTQHSLSLICQLIGNNHNVAIENPCYDAARYIFQNYHYKIFPINLTTDGIDMKELKNSKCSVVYTTPGHQFPFGMSMPNNKRMELLEWARENNAWIIEDDYDGEFRNNDTFSTSLQGMDSYNKVIYVGTFSKALVPIIQMSYVVLPIKLVNIYLEKYQFFKQLIPVCQQNTMKEFISTGNWSRHIMRTEKKHKSKMDILQSAIKQVENKRIKVISANSPLHLLVEFSSYSEQKILNRVNEYNIKIYSTSKYWSIKPVKPVFLIGFGTMTESQIKKGISLFNKAFLQI